MSLFAKFRDVARSIGFVNAFLFAMSRLLTRYCGGRLRIVKYYFMQQPIMPESHSFSRPGAFRLKWIDADCSLFSQIDRPPAIIAARFAQGARCLVAVTGETQLAGFLWLVLGPYEEDEVRARFCPRPCGEAAWDFDVTILPRYRMGRLFSYLWCCAAVELAERGFHQTVSRISAFNPHSLSAHRRLGATVVGDALFLCAGRWQLMKASMAPHWHLSWRDDQRPTLEIGSDSTVLSAR